MKESFLERIDTWAQKLFFIKEISEENKSRLELLVTLGEDKIYLSNEIVTSTLGIHRGGFEMEVNDPNPTYLSALMPVINVFPEMRIDKRTLHKDKLVLLSQPIDKPAKESLVDYVLEPFKDIMSLDSNYPEAVTLALNEKRSQENEGKYWKFRQFVIGSRLYSLDVGIINQDDKLRYVITVGPDKNPKGNVKILLDNLGENVFISQKTNLIKKTDLSYNTNTHID